MKLTPEQEAEIIRMYQKGGPVTEVLQKFDIQARLLYSILRRHGLSPSRRKRLSQAPPGTFICTECGKIKPLSERCDEFNICFQCRKKRVMRAAMKKWYHISEDEYNAMLAKQDGKCAICGKGFDLSSKNERTPVCIDHCHKTGEFRGLLCRYCNQGLGHFKDDPQLLAAAIAYLLDKEPS